MSEMQTPIFQRAGAAMLLGLAVVATAPDRATAQTATPSAALSQCLKIADAAERLACYDRLSRPAAAPPPPMTAPAPAGSSPYGPVPSHSFGAPAATSQTTPQQFGSEQLPASRQSRARTLNRIAANVVSFSAGPTGRFTVELDNGQVWKQIEGDETFARYDKRTTRTALISRGVLGSYDLTFNDRNAVFKVMRVR
jgi:hypothetical protein